MTSKRFPLDTLCEAAKSQTGATDPVAAMLSVLNVLSSFMGLEMGALALLDDSGKGDRQVTPFVIAASTQGAFAQPAASGTLPVRDAQRVPDRRRPRRA